MVGKYTTTDEVVFAAKGDLLLLGARTLEGLNLRVDPLRKELIEAGPVPAAPMADYTEEEARAYRESFIQVPMCSKAWPHAVRPRTRAPKTNRPRRRRRK